jgi:hypothetical protein
MSALRAWDVIPQPTGVPRQSIAERFPVKRPELRAIQGFKDLAVEDDSAKANSRLASVKSPLKAKSQFGFLIICGAVLVAALISVLVLNTNVIKGSFELARLQTQIRQVDQDIQDRREQLSRAEASLSNRALELGLVPAANPEPINITNYVAAITGEVIGGATARTGR